MIETSHAIIEQDNCTSNINVIMSSWDGEGCGFLPIKHILPTLFALLVDSVIDSLLSSPNNGRKGRKHFKTPIPYVQPIGKDFLIVHAPRRRRDDKPVYSKSMRTMRRPEQAREKNSKRPGSQQK